MNSDIYLCQLNRLSNTKSFIKFGEFLNSNITIRFVLLHVHIVGSFQNLKNIKQKTKIKISALQRTFSKSVNFLRITSNWWWLFSSHMFFLSEFSNIILWIWLKCSGNVFLYYKEWISSCASFLMLNLNSKPFIYYVEWEKCLFKNGR